MEDTSHREEIPIGCVFMLYKQQHEQKEKRMD